MGEKLAYGLSAIIRNAGLTACVNQIGSLACIFFGIEKADDYQSVKCADTGMDARYFREMLAAGIYLAPSQFEAMFISYAHTENDINETLNRAERIIKKINI
jgi:glutamate-1-semialdehyde 2,1-aminomutase